jgi:hypothetical protein
MNNDSRDAQARATAWRAVWGASIAALSEPSEPAD